LVPPEKRRASHDWIRKEIQSGRQAFVVCPLIDDSEKLEATSARREYEYLKTVFPDLRLGLIHGRLRSAQKEEVMQDIKGQKIDLLVATAVIEVGIDVPNATIMIIENAERFGLSQLHQFRGRVGRGEHQSYCLLFSGTDDPDTLKRLKALTETTDGFKLAELDLKFRGPGEIFGTRQSGAGEFKLADFTNAVLISRARNAAEKVLTEKLCGDMNAAVN
jgi:ATP-dependent DNA helicase RecG